MRLLNTYLTSFKSQKRQPASFEGNFVELKGAICYPSIDIYHRLLALKAFENLFKFFSNVASVLNSKAHYKAEGG